MDPCACKSDGQNRVLSLRYEGAEIGADDLFVVAMTSYRASGGGGFPGTGAASDVTRTNVKLSEALRAHVAQNPLGPTPAPTVWRFAPGSGQRYMIETSPRAANHLEEISHFLPEPMGLSDAGFLRLRVTL